MEKIKCNACDVEKDITSFYKCKECRDGISKVCKMCKVKGLKSKKNENKIHQFNLDFRKSEAKHYTLAGCTKDDYLEMYDIMEKMGYDFGKGDIHQQFLDRHNPKLKKPMKYKKRDYNTENHFLPDGSVNPLSRQTKNPHSDE